MILTKNYNLGANLVPELKCAPIFLKFGTQKKLNMLLKNILIGIDELDTKLHIWANFGPKTEICYHFYKIWHSEQIKEANYKYTTWN